MTTIEHYLSTRIQTMATMLEIAAQRLRTRGDTWGAGECEREARHAREVLAGLSDAESVLDEPPRGRHTPSADDSAIRIPGRMK